MSEIHENDCRCLDCQEYTENAINGPIEKVSA
jgi:hypothetical protein